MGISLDLFYLNFSGLLESIGLCLFSRFGKISVIFSLNICSTPLSYSFHRRADNKCQSIITLQVSEALFISSNHFSVVQIQ